HLRQRQLGEQKRRAQVHGDDLLEILQRIFFDRNDRAVVAGIVHKDIDAAKLLAGVLIDVLAIGFLGEIGDREGRGTSRGSNFLLRGGKLSFGASRQKYRCAFVREEASNGAADATARSGDQSNLIL